MTTSDLRWRGAAQLNCQPPRDKHWPHFFDPFDGGDQWPVGRFVDSNVHPRMIWKKNQPECQDSYIQVSYHHNQNRSDKSILQYSLGGICHKMYICMCICFSHKTPYGAIQKVLAQVRIQPLSPGTFPNIHPMVTPLVFEGVVATNLIRSAIDRMRFGLAVPGRKLWYCHSETHPINRLSDAISTYINPNSSEQCSIGWIWVRLYP
jgi:hypothetical protein